MPALVGMELAELSELARRTEPRKRTWSHGPDENSKHSTSLKAGPLLFGGTQALSTGTRVSLAYGLVPGWISAVEGVCVE